MDSLLNLQYKKLRTKCDSIQKINLKDDQIKWLAVRDKQFKYNRQQVHKEAKESGYDGGQDEIMILTDKNTMFVKDRVIELISKSPNSYSADKYKSKLYKISLAYSSFGASVRLCRTTKRVKELNYLLLAVVGISLKKSSYQSKPSLYLPTNDRSVSHYTFSINQIHVVFDYNAPPVLY